MGGGLGKLWQGLASLLPGRRPPPDIPEALWRREVAALPFLARLTPTELARLRGLCARFLQEKQFAAAGDLELSDPMCLSIALQGCLPVLNLGLEWYQGWVEILVYPGEFLVHRQVMDENGVIHEYREVASGEAWHGGPLILSWSDAAMAGEGYNVVIHEFAHKLDMINGPADGIPPLPDRAALDRWVAALDQAYGDFCRQVDRAEALPESAAQEAWDALPLDPYGTENPGEFFAVASESFFETPTVLAQAYPTFYRELAAFYHQDPAGAQS